MPAKEIIQLNGMEIHFSLDENDTQNHMTMFRCVIHPHVRMPAPHYHRHFDEAVYGLKGTVIFTIDGREVPIAPGDSCFIPRGIVHGFNNKTDDAIEFLSVITPGILGPSYFKDIAEVLNAGTPPDMSRLMAVMTKHGLVPVVTN